MKARQLLEKLKKVSAEKQVIIEAGFNDFTVGEIEDFVTDNHVRIKLRKVKNKN